jgi:hypothetical protein
MPILRLYSCAILMVSSKEIVSVCPEAIPVVRGIKSNRVNDILFPEITEYLNIFFFGILIFNLNDQHLAVASIKYYLGSLSANYYLHLEGGDTPFDYFSILTPKHQP